VGAHESEAIASLCCSCPLFCVHQVLQHHGIQMHKLANCCALRPFKLRCA
jgi:hypothetical protein